MYNNHTKEPEFAYAYLSKMRIPTLAFGFGVGNDDFNSRKKLPRLHKAERMWTTSFH
jgi:hypothetical protein